MLESKIKKQCTEKLQAWGWMVIHLIQTNQNGIPDTICLRKSETIFIEFKRIGEDPRELQVYRIRKLCDQGFEVIVARSLLDIAHLQ